MSVSQKITSLYSRDFDVSPVSRHFPYSRDFVVSPVSKHVPYSRDFVVSPVSRHFPYSVTLLSLSGTVLSYSKDFVV